MSRRAPAAIFPGARTSIHHDEDHLKVANYRAVATLYGPVTVTVRGVTVPVVVSVMVKNPLPVGEFFPE